MSGRTLNIEICENGFLLTVNLDLDENPLLYACDDTEGDKLAVVHLLNLIKNELGFGGSKHDEQRIFVEIRNQHEKDDDKEI